MRPKFLNMHNILYTCTAIHRQSTWQRETIIIIIIKNDFLGRKAHTHRNVTPISVSDISLYPNRVIDFITVYMSS